LDLNRVVKLLMGMVIAPLTKLGIDYVARRGKPEAEMTPQERDQARSARELAARAQKAAKLARRLGR
jgi:hypothetical protein